jgi:hypothetical protein
VADALEARHGLRRSVARFLAGEVERRVLSLEYHVVSTALIAELIRNELLAWGLAEPTTSVFPSVQKVDVAAPHQSNKER